MNAKNENPSEPLWIKIAKAIAYLLGLLLAGVGTVDAAALVASAI